MKRQLPIGFVAAVYDRRNGFITQLLIQRRSAVIDRRYKKRI
jgi:hypothetical protein